MDVLNVLYCHQSVPCALVFVNKQEIFENVDIFDFYKICIHLKQNDVEFKSVIIVNKGLIIFEIQASEEWMDIQILEDIICSLAF